MYFFKNALSSKTLYCIGNILLSQAILNIRSSYLSADKHELYFSNLCLWNDLTSIGENIPRRTGRYSDAF